MIPEKPAPTLALEMMEVGIYQYHSARTVSTLCLTHRNFESPWRTSDGVSLSVKLIAICTVVCVQHPEVK